VSPIDAIVIGASLGGLHACRVIFSGLGAQCQPFLVLAQHRHATSPNWLVPLLQSHTDLTVVEASDKCVPQKGHLYVAPADYHLLLDAEGFELSVDPPVLFARPSIDVLFESAADTYGDHLMAVILTGSSSDGAKGAARVKRSGGTVLVQNPRTAESPECPASVLKETSVDAVLDLPELAQVLAETCRTGRTPRGLPPQG
jgi:two-component system chemotaxis response regulator CheB